MSATTSSVNFAFLGNPLTPVFFFSPHPLAQVPAVIYVSSTVGMQIGDTIQIMLNSGELFQTTITAVNKVISANAALNSNNITINPGLPSPASAGNIVVDLTQSNNVPPTTASDIV